MEEKLACWRDKYRLKNLRIAGYRGGYPIIELDREENMAILNMSKKEINKVLRQAEARSGMEIGVGWNFRKTSFILINDETIVICGHEKILEKVLKTLF